MDAAADWPIPLREMRLVCFPAALTGMPLMVWSLQPGEKVSRQIAQAGEQFALSTGLDAQVAFIQRIPAGAAEFAEVGEITLVRADWVPEQFICVGRGGMKVKLSGKEMMG